MTVPIGYTLHKGSATHIRDGAHALCGTRLPKWLRGYDGPLTQVGCQSCVRLYNAVKQRPRFGC